MPKFTFEVLLKANAAQLKQGFQDATSSMRGLEKQGIRTGQKTTSSLDRVQVSLKALQKINAFTGLMSAGNLLVNSLHLMESTLKDLHHGAAAAFEGIKSWIERGAETALEFGKKVVEVNSDIEDTKLGMAALVGSFSEFTDASGRAVDENQAFAASLEYVNKLLPRLQKIAALNIGDLHDYTKGFMNLVGAVTKFTGKGEDAEGKIITITKQLSAAAATLKGQFPQGFNQVVREYQELLQGRARVSNPFAMKFGFTTEAGKEQLKEWVESGEVVDRMIERFKIFEIAGSEAQHTFTGLASSLRLIPQQFFMNFHGGMFEDIKGYMLFIRDTILNLKDDGKGISPIIDNITSNMQTIFAGSWGEIKKLVAQLTDFAMSDGAQTLFVSIGNLLNESAVTVIRLGQDLIASLIKHQPEILTLINRVREFLFGIRNDGNFVENMVSATLNGIREIEVYMVAVERIFVEKLKMIHEMFENVLFLPSRIQTALIADKFQSIGLNDQALQVIKNQEANENTVRKHMNKFAERFGGGVKGLGENIMAGAGLSPEELQAIRLELKKRDESVNAMSDTYKWEAGEASGFKSDYFKHVPKPRSADGVIQKFKQGEGLVEKYVQGADFATKVKSIEEKVGRIADIATKGTFQTKDGKVTHVQLVFPGADVKPVDLEVTNMKPEHYTELQKAQQKLFDQFEKSGRSMGQRNVRGKIVPDGRGGFTNY